MIFEFAFALARIREMHAVLVLKDLRHYTFPHGVADLQAFSAISLFSL